jgi:hypothetical protein
MISYRFVSSHDMQAASFDFKTKSKMPVNLWEKIKAENTKLEK